MAKGRVRQGEAQGRDRRIYLAWRASKRHAGDWYQRGYGCSPLMGVARRFRIPIREVRRIIAEQRGPDYTPPKRH